MPTLRIVRADPDHQALAAAYVEAARAYAPEQTRERLDELDRTGQAPKPTPAGQELARLWRHYCDESDVTMPYAQVLDRALRVPAAESVAKPITEVDLANTRMALLLEGLRFEPTFAALKARVDELNRELCSGLTKLAPACQGLAIEFKLQPPHERHERAELYNYLAIQHASSHQHRDQKRGPFDAGALKRWVLHLPTEQGPARFEATSSGVILALNYGKPSRMTSDATCRLQLSEVVSCRLLEDVPRLDWTFLWHRGAPAASPHPLVYLGEQQGYRTRFDWAEALVPKFKELAPTSREEYSLRVTSGLLAIHPDRLRLEKPRWLGEPRLYGTALITDLQNPAFVTFDGMRVPKAFATMPAGGRTTFAAAVMAVHLAKIAHPNIDREEAQAYVRPSTQAPRGITFTANAEQVYQHLVKAAPR